MAYINNTAMINFYDFRNICNGSCEICVNSCNFEFCQFGNLSVQTGGKSLFYSEYYKVIKIQGESSVYLLSQNSLPEPEITEEFVQVEFLENHVYCLLPSISSDLGSVTLYSSMPGFIKDIFFHLSLGKV